MQRHLIYFFSASTDCFVKFAQQKLPMTRKGQQTFHWAYHQSEWFWHPWLWTHRHSISIVFLGHIDNLSINRLCVMFIKFFSGHQNPWKSHPTKASFVFLCLIFVNCQHLETREFYFIAFFRFGDIYFISLFNLKAEKRCGTLFIILYYVIEIPHTSMTVGRFLVPLSLREIENTDRGNALVCNLHVNSF